MKLMGVIWSIFVIALTTGCVATTAPPVITPQWSTNPNNPADRAFVYSVQDRQLVTHGAYVFKENANGSGGAVGGSHATEGPNQTRAKLVGNILGPLSRAYGAKHHAPLSVSNVVSETFLQGGSAQAGASSEQSSEIHGTVAGPESLYDCMADPQCNDSIAQTDTTEE